MNKQNKSETVAGIENKNAVARGQVDQEGKNR